MPSGVKDIQLIVNLQAQLDYLKNKVFGSTSELRHHQIPGQFSIFDSPVSDEKPAEIIEPEIIKVQAYTKKSKPKAAYL